MTPDNVFYVFKLYPHDIGHIERMVVGKFVLHDGHFEILEDHGLPPALEQASPSEGANVIHRLSHSMYYDVVCLRDLLEGFRPELIEESSNKAELQEDLRAAIAANAKPTPQAEEFEYTRKGDSAKRLSLSDGRAFLDSHLLTEDEIKHIETQVANGEATLAPVVKKSESEFYHPIGKILDEDSLVPGAGNLKAYRQNKSAPGIHMHVNIHDMKHLNATHGYNVGHKAIAAVGRVLVHVTENLTAKEGRVFRVGKDRFAIHTPTPESATLIARGVRQHLDAIPEVNGTHKLSVSVGIGSTKDHADWALHDSTISRKSLGYEPGKSKSHISVKIPGGITGAVD